MRAPLTSLLRFDGLALLDRLTPRRGYRARIDLPYGNAPHEKLDLYLPEQGKGPWPAVLFLHGGRWTNGDKAQYRFVAHAFATAGIAAAIVGYRTWPLAGFPAFVQDAASAQAFLHGNAAELGLARDRIFLVGHSAGAHIAALLATATPWLAEAGAARSSIAGFVGIAGPYDFLPIREAELREIFGPEESHEASQPILYVDGREPPSLLLHGRRDRTVAPRNSARFGREINRRGGSARVLTYDRLDHTRIVGALSARIGPLFGPVLGDCLAFIEETMAGTADLSPRREATRER